MTTSASAWADVVQPGPIAAIGSGPSEQAQQDWEPGTHYLDADVTIGKRITIKGDVTLELRDGYTLTLEDMIHVSKGNSLTITTPAGSQGTGKVIATQKGDYAGIGGVPSIGCGEIKILSGNVIVQSDGGKNNKGAGIGDSADTSNPNKDGGKITIAGGTVSVDIGDSSGAAIGGGDSANGGEITITGGKVIVTGGKRGGAGIGGGAAAVNNTSAFKNGGKITITGGQIIARGSDGAAAIGGGHGASHGGEITINGGVIKAYGSMGLISADPEVGSVIGGGTMGSGGNIVINGGVLDLVTDIGSETGNPFISVGIGHGSTERYLKPPLGTLSSAANGSAWITIDSANSINIDMTGFTSGAIFQAGDGSVYGSTTMPQDVLLSDDKTLTVLSDATLTIPKDTTLTVKASATLDVKERGRIINLGVIDFPDGLPEGVPTVKALIESLKISGDGEVRVKGAYYTDSDVPLPSPVSPADKATIDKFVVEDAGLEVKNGALSPDVAVDVISAAIEADPMMLNGAAVSKDTIVPLKIVSVDAKQKGGIAELRFTNIVGSDLISVPGPVGVEELNIIKIYKRDGMQRLTQHIGDGKGPNGTFVVSHDGAIVDAVRSDDKDYELTVYILDDDGKLDMASTVGQYVVDPIVFVKSGSGSRHGSGGACSTGAGLAALAALAVLGANTLRRRSK